MNNSKNRKFDLVQALRDASEAWRNGERNEGGYCEEEATVWRKITRKTGLTKDKLDKITQECFERKGNASELHVYYSIMHYMRSHKIDTGHIL
jgi:hypothetical protein